MNSKYDSRLVMKYVYRSSTFSFSHLYISLRRVRHDVKPSEEKDMDLTRCNLGKFLVVPTFVARRLHSCKDARDPSSESWNYFSRRLTSNFCKKTVSTPFTDLFLDLRTCLATLCSTKIKRPEIFYVLNLKSRDVQLTIIIRVVLFFPYL